MGNESSKGITCGPRWSCQLGVGGNITESSIIQHDTYWPDCNKRRWEYIYFMANSDAKYIIDKIKTQREHITKEDIGAFIKYGRPDSHINRLIVELFNPPDINQFRSEALAIRISAEAARARRSYD